MIERCGCGQPATGEVVVYYGDIFLGTIREWMCDSCARLQRPDNMDELKDELRQYGKEQASFEIGMETNQSVLMFSLADCASD